VKSGCGHDGGVILILGRFFGGGKNSSWALCETEKFRCDGMLKGLMAAHETRRPAAVAVDL